MNRTHGVERLLELIHNEIPAGTDDPMVLRNGAHVCLQSGWIMKDANAPRGYRLTDEGRTHLFTLLPHYKAMIK